MIDKFWISYTSGQRPKVYIFEAYDANSGYFYFKEYKNETALICKKIHEMHVPHFRPMIIPGGRKEAA